MYKQQILFTKKNYSNNKVIQIKNNYSNKKGIARIHDMLNDHEKAIVFYKKVLILDSSNIESIACLGAHFFYSDQVFLILFLLFIFL
jgi:uncharacterized protein (DUF2225 family)